MASFLKSWVEYVDGDLYNVMFMSFLFWSLLAFISGKALERIVSRWTEAPLVFAMPFYVIGVALAPMAALYNGEEGIAYALLVAVTPCAIRFFRKEKVDLTQDAELVGEGLIAIRSSGKRRQ